MRALVWPSLVLNVAVMSLASWSAYPASGASAVLIPLGWFLIGMSAAVAIGESGK